MAGLQVSGNLALSVSGTEIAVSGSVTTALTAGGTTVLGLTGNAALSIRNNGIAGRFALSVTAAGNVPAALNFSLAGSFVFEVNTTRSVVTSIAGVTLNPALPDRLNPSDTSANAWARVAVNGALLNIMGLTVTGGLEIAVGSTAELRMRVINATAATTVGGLNVASGTANATFLIRSDGIAGKVTLSGTSQPDASLFFAWQAVVRLTQNSIQPRHRSRFLSEHPPSLWAPARSRRLR